MKLVIFDDLFSCSPYLVIGCLDALNFAHIPTYSKMPFEPFLSIRLWVNQSNWSLQSLCGNAFRFYNFIYTNKNTNNPQKYPLFLSN